MSTPKTVKYLRLLKDGWVIPYNELLKDDPRFQAFELPVGEDPHEPQYLGIESDESVEAREAAVLAAARKLVAKADAAAKTEKK